MGNDLELVDDDPDVLLRQSLSGALPAQPSTPAPVEAEQATASEQATTSSDQAQQLLTPRYPRRVRMQPDRFCPTIHH